MKNKEDKFLPQWAFRLSVALISEVASGNETSLMQSQLFYHSPVILDFPCIPKFVEQRF